MSTYPIEEQARHAADSQSFLATGIMGGIDFDGPALLKAQADFIGAQQRFIQSGKSGDTDFLKAQSDFNKAQAIALRQLGVS